LDISRNPTTDPRENGFLVKLPVPRNTNVGSRQGFAQSCACCGGETDWADWMAEGGIVVHCHFRLLTFAGVCFATFLQVFEII
jgi:hypothetical protein